jgi:hypothetical protein
MLPTVPTQVGNIFLLDPAPPVIFTFALGVVPFLLVAAKFILGLIGFSATGPVAGKPLSITRPHVTYSHDTEYAGSFAALIQASIGNIAGGSLFAALQSFAMGGTTLCGVLSTVGGFVGGIVGAIALAIAAFF